MKLSKYQKADELVLYFETEPETLKVPSEAENVVRLAIAEALRYEQFEAGAEVSVTFCNDDFIRELNREYREKDTPTDVLSFPIFDADEEDPVAEEIVPLGDIVLNLDRAALQGAELGHSLLREVAFLTVHSILHLLGYDHERSPEEDEEMCQKQRDIIAILENGEHIL
ncbi:MAG: rRNA maturation RNase YbeY [Clostridia bacterium]|nr:rRNA maturation RNase YbeY [Clostridia bacterium]